MALSPAAEELVATLGCRLIEVHPGSWRWRRQGQLIEMQRRELRRDPVVIRVDVRQVAESIGGRDRKLRRVVETRVEETAFTMHFQVRDECVPVGHRSPCTG